MLREIISTAHVGIGDAPPQLVARQVAELQVGELVSAITSTLELRYVTAQRAYTLIHQGAELRSYQEGEL